MLVKRRLLFAETRRGAGVGEPRVSLCGRGCGGGRLGRLPRRWGSRPRPLPHQVSIHRAILYSESGGPVKRRPLQVSRNFCALSRFLPVLSPQGLFFSNDDPHSCSRQVQQLQTHAHDIIFRALGYNYKDGEVEKQDKFLKRMTGIMRLYASIMVAPPLRGQHPHGVENAWRWLTEVMNLEPRPDITATMIFDLLEVTGNALLKCYGKQFVKLIQLFRADFVPKIVKVTPEGSGGPIRRLENFMDVIIRKGAISPPAGMLSTNFWYT